MSTKNSIELFEKNAENELKNTVLKTNSDIASFRKAIEFVVLQNELFFGYTDTTIIGLCFIALAESLLEDPGYTNLEKCRQESSSWETDFQAIVQTVLLTIINNYVTTKSKLN